MKIKYFHEHGAKKKMWDPDKIGTHDLPDTSWEL